MLHHANPPGFALLGGQHQAEWAVTRGKQLAIHVVGHQRARIGKRRVKLGQREDGAVSIVRGHQQVARERRSTDVVPLRQSGAVQQFGQSDTFEGMIFAVVGFGLQGHTRHGLQIGQGNLQRRAGDAVASHTIDAQDRVGGEGREGQ